MFDDLYTTPNVTALSKLLDGSGKEVIIIVKARGEIMLVLLGV
jgi:hypothetical protein